jgi:adenylate cyclase
MSNPIKRIRDLDYTTSARRVAFKYPVFNTIGTQVNFWVIAFTLLNLVLYFFSHATRLDVPMAKDPLPFFLISFLLSFAFGICTGTAEYYVFNKISLKKSIGFLILTKGFAYIAIMTILFFTMRFTIGEFIVDVRFLPEERDQMLTIETTIYTYLTIITYTLAMGMVISFIVQINSKFGPGVLIPILLGKYIEPKQEERIFLFLDLKSSTAIAENIGHIKYSQMIRDCFIDINAVAKKYQAEIYQYVGDEVVLTWKTMALAKNIRVIECFFEVQFLLESKQEYYLKEYGVQPEFKAGAHLGVVTAVEVGSIKREVAYHGDTMNVTSRIEGKTKEFKADLLISKTLADTILWDDRYNAKPIVSVYLSGRQKPITILDVQSYLS